MHLLLFILILITIALRLEHTVVLREQECDVCGIGEDEGLVQRTPRTATRIDAHGRPAPATRQAPHLVFAFTSTWGRAQGLGARCAAALRVRGGVTVCDEVRGAAETRLERRAEGRALVCAARGDVAPEACRRDAVCAERAAPVVHRRAVARQTRRPHLVVLARHWSSFSHSHSEWC